MPQMMPLNWMIIFITIYFIFFMLISMMFFFYNKFFKINNLNKIIYLNWIWMW